MKILTNPKSRLKEGNFKNFNFKELEKNFKKICHSKTHLQNLKSKYIKFISQDPAKRMRYHKESLDVLKAFS